MEHPTPLVGRSVELETLRAWLDVLQHRRGRTILIIADSGVGKTRLAEVARIDGDAFNNYYIATKG